MSGAPVTLFGPDGRPAPRASVPRAPSASYGRHVRRKAASSVGTLVTWTLHYVSARLAEYERRKGADRAMDLYVNSSLAHGILEGLVTDVVGTGLTPQPQPMADWLGFDAAWQEQWTRDVYAWFEIVGLDCRRWADAQRRATIYGLQALAAFLWRLEGASFFQVVSRPVPGSPVSTRLLPICPSRVRTPSDLGEDERVFDGVEVDELGAPRRIWVAPAAGSSYLQTFSSGDMQPLDVWDEATGLPKVLIVTRVRNIAEYREDGILTAILKDIRDGEDLREAASIKALISNTFALFVAEEGPGFPGLDGGEPSNQVLSWADRVQELERGMIIQGQPHQKPTEIKTDAPGPNYEIMVKDIHTGLGISTGRGRENLIREYTSSYSASQASMENEAKWSDQDRLTLADTFCQPWWMWTQLEGVLRGHLPARSVEDFRRELYAYTRTAWLRPPVRHIDKFKIAKADETRLGNRTTTLSKIYAEMGEDWRTAVTQSLTEEAFVRRERKRLKLPDPDLVEALKKAAGRLEDDDGEE
ncbi:MAG: phage portal protein [Thermodesulfobacteriota bacterium]